MHTQASVKSFRTFGSRVGRKMEWSASIYDPFFGTLSSNKYRIELYCKHLVTANASAASATSSKFRQAAEGFDEGVNTRFRKIS